MPEVAAHRGGSLLAPENTMGAFRAAHERFSGVWLEMDVRTCAGGELAVIHDHTVDRTTSGSGPVAAHTLEELHALDAAARFEGWGAEPVPSLEDVLAEGAGAGWRVLLEIKNVPGQPDFDPAGQSAVEALTAALETAAFPPHRIEVICFWPPTLDALKSRRPEIRVGLLTIPGVPETPGPGFTALEAAQVCADRGYEIAGPHQRTPDIDAPTVDRIRTMGVSVSVWTANSAADVRRMIDAGVDRITSDRPDLVYEALDQS